MRTALAATVLAAAVATPLAPLPVSAQGAATVYEGARLIDGTGAAPIENGVLVVANGRITAVGASGAVQAPAGATRVSLAGKTIIPALVDAHVHTATARDQLADQQRGFSFDAEGELDLRFDTDSGEPAWRLIARLDATQLANLIYEYGEERHSRRVARAIVEHRTEKPHDHVIAKVAGEERDVERRRAHVLPAWLAGILTRHTLDLTTPGCHGGTQSSCVVRVVVNHREEARTSHLDRRRRRQSDLGLEECLGRPGRLPEIQEERTLFFERRGR